MPTPRSRPRRAAALVGLTIGVAAAVVGCAPGGGATSDESIGIPPEIAERFDEIDAAVGGWSSAADLAEAQRHAEAARNLVVGPDGPVYGDATADGTVDGATEVGLLPGLTGAAGLAQPPVNACVERDVLGGSWDDPQARWDGFDAVLASWRPDANTMPQLASHPLRVVGWATLTLEADTLDVARGYAGHARLHVDISRSAYDACSS